MIRRTVLQWQALFDEHRASGLTAAAFCREKQLCQKYFSQRRKQLAKNKGSADSSAFIKTKAQAMSPSVIGMGRITLCTIAGELSLPATVEPEWLASLIRALR